MAFSKAFPTSTDKYTKWEEVFLTDAEEHEQDLLCKIRNIELMKECMDDAKKILEEKGFKSFQSDIVRIAAVLFEKRASHAVYHKERKAKEKFKSL